MPSPEATSAVVVRIPVPAALTRSRRRWDWAAGVGVPAHVTILYPFVPPGGLVPKVRRSLAAIAANQEPFLVVFDEVRRFPGVVYLAPRPVAPFLLLTEAVAGRFPDFPPYGGAFAEVIPHLTVAESHVAPLDEIAVDTAAVLPFRHRVTALEVLVEGGDGRWHRRWRIPLGVRP
jgi:2'-5' RNA ligase